MTKKKSKPAAAPAPGPKALPVKIVSARREITKLTNKRDDIKNSIRSLERQVQAEGRVTYVDKLRKQIRQLDKQATKLTKEVLPDLRKLRNEQDGLRHEKKNIRSQIYRDTKKLDKLYEEKDYDAYKKLSSKIIHNQASINKINRELGVIPMPEEGVIPPKPEKEEIKERGNWIYEIPLPIWQAATRLREELGNDNWDWFIVDGEKLSTDMKSNIEIAGTDMSRKAYIMGSKMKIQVSYNLVNRTIRFAIIE